VRAARCSCTRRSSANARSWRCASVVGARRVGHEALDLRVRQLALAPRRRLARRRDLLGVARHTRLVSRLLRCLLGRQQLSASARVACARLAELGGALGGLRDGQLAPLLLKVDVDRQAVRTYTTVEQLALQLALLLVVGALDVGTLLAEALKLAAQLAQRRLDHHDIEASASVALVRFATAAGRFLGRRHLRHHLVAVGRVGRRCVLRVGLCQKRAIHVALRNDRLDQRLLLDTFASQRHEVVAQLRKLGLALGGVALALALHLESGDAFEQVAVLRLQRLESGKCDRATVALELHEQRRHLVIELGARVRVRLIGAFELLGLQLPALGVGSGGLERGRQRDVCACHALVLGALLCNQRCL
jgi:hypothetical protein